MLNYLWAGMILIGIVYASFAGRIPDITNAAIDSSKEAVSLCITMMGVLSMWMGPEPSLRTFFRRIHRYQFYR